MRQLLRFVLRLLGGSNSRPRDLVPTGHLHTGDDPDEAVLNRLRANGSDLNKPTHVLFYLYAPTETGAKRLAERGVDAALRAEGRPSGAGDGTWVCLLQGTFVAAAAVLRQYSARFEALAEAEGGEYDGWEAAVQSTQ